MPQAPKSHRQHAGKPRDTRRYGAAERGYDGQWTKDKTAVLKQMVAESCDPFCRYCRREVAKTLDHAVPPSRVGPVGSTRYWEQFNDRLYWVPCCMRCNSDKGDRTVSELKRERPVMYERLVEVMRERGVNLDGWTGERMRLG